jgi:hypothetical protein
MADIEKTKSGRWGISSQAANSPAIIGKMVSITISPPGLLFEAGSLRNKPLTIQAAMGKINIPPKNNTAKPVATPATVPAIPAANHPHPETTAPGPPPK